MPRTDHVPRSHLPRLHVPRLRVPMPHDHLRTVVTGVAVALTIALVVDAGVAPGATKKPSTSGAAQIAAFRTFSSCSKFLSYVRPIALEQVGPYGFGGGTDFAKRTTGGTPVTVAPGTATPAAAAPVEEAAESSSTTNTQEPGVDEGDLVETDGRYVYAAVSASVTITDVSAGKVVATLPLPVNRGGEPQLLLDGPRLAVVTPVFSNIGGETVVSIYNVSNPAAPVLFNTTHLEGITVAGRAVDNRLRLVLNTSFGQRVAQKFPAPGSLNSQADVDKAIKVNRKIVATVPASDWLPRRYTVDANGARGPIETVLPCSQVGRPADSSGLGLTWVATVDLNVPNPSPVVRGAAGVVANAGVVYSSPDTLYVATQRFWTGGRPSNASVTTELHAFSLRAADGARWLASGRFNGTLLNQFSMSEHDGAIRIASTRFDAGFGGTTESGVQVMMLDSADNRRLKVVGEVWGLGTNENIYAVRFVGPTGYVVTFRQVDPLYVLDLSDRRAPRMVGELKIPGYSAYLHPIGDGLLLGIGQDATEQGRRTGAQVSLFDVADPSKPTRLAAIPVGSNTAAEYDHRAFLWWPATRDVLLPTMSVQPNGFPTYGVNVTRVGSKATPTLTNRGLVTHEKYSTSATTPPASTPPTTNPRGVAPAPAPIIAPPPEFPTAPIVRSMIVSGDMVTVSSNGLLVSDLTQLGDKRWVPFPR
jgi:uncharacterized secreted protein with C-terminal beta-propeller domain